MDARALEVAIRAQEIAGWSGVDLPADLALWRLAGGQPEIRPQPGHPDDLGLVLERAHLTSVRRQRGVHYTPQDLAAELVERVMGDDPPSSVCDLSCGGGALLLAAGRALVARGVPPPLAVARLWGADIDPVAVATTEAALLLWAGARPPAEHLRVADTLLDPPVWGPFDVVVGNPPFLSQLDSATTRSNDDNERIRRALGKDAVGAYTDTAALFLLRSAAVTRAGGCLALVQPQSVLAARDSSGVRGALAIQSTLREVWVPAGRAFTAAVDACVVVLDRTEGASASQSSWSGRLAADQGVPVVDLDHAATVGREASVGAAFRAEYYGIAPHVREAHDCPSGRPLLTAGLVDLGRASWGERPATMARQRWRRPVVDVDALDGRAAAWAARTEGPKLVVATQTRVIEVVVDEDGEYLPSVPLVVVWPAPERLWSIAAALAAPPVTAWVAAQVAGAALSRGSLKVSASLVRAVPLPVDHAAWGAGTAALQAGDLVGFAESMTAAYGCGAEVSDWWLERAGSAWSGVPASR